MDRLVNGLRDGESLRALAPLGVARARRALGQHDQAAKAYQEFLEVWRNADADLPVLVKARSEHARLAVR